MTWIVRVDIPNHPQELLSRQPQYLFDRQVFHEDVWYTVTSKRTNAARFISQEEAVRAKDLFYNYWHRLNPDRQYIMTIEAANRYKVRWVIKAGHAGDGRYYGWVAEQEGDTHRYAGYGLRNGVPTASPALFKTQEEAEAATREWIESWNDDSVGLVVARRIPQ